MKEHPFPQALGGIQQTPRFGNWVGQRVGGILLAVPKTFFEGLKRMEPVQLRCMIGAANTPGCVRLHGQAGD